MGSSSARADKPRPHRGDGTLHDLRPRPASSGWPCERQRLRPPARDPERALCPGVPLQNLMAQAPRAQPAPPNAGTRPKAQPSFLRFGWEWRRRPRALAGPHAMRSSEDEGHSRSRVRRGSQRICIVGAADQPTPTRSRRFGRITQNDRANRARPSGDGPWADAIEVKSYLLLLRPI